MPLSRDNVTERKLKLIRRAQFRLRQSLERVDWEEAVLFPEVEALKSGKAVLQLPAGSAIEFEIIDEDSHQTKTDRSE